VAIIGVTLVVVRSANQGCGLPAPTVTVPAELRSSGVVPISPLDARDIVGLEELAQQVGPALDRTNLLTATAATPVTEHALRSDRHDATVVPLKMAVAGGGSRIAALAVFLDDCAGRHYFSGLRDLAHQSAPTDLALAFPSIAQDTAVARIGGTPQLVYDQDPAHPVWRNPQSGATTPATSA
jgi:hypothetical protein